MLSRVKFRRAWIFFAVSVHVAAAAWLLALLIVGKIDLSRGADASYWLEIVVWNFLPRFTVTFIPVLFGYGYHRS